MKSDLERVHLRVELIIAVVAAVFLIMSVLPESNAAEEKTKVKEKLSEFPVRPFEKIFITGEDVSPDSLMVLSRLPRASVKVKMKGNMLRDSLITALNDGEFEKVEVVFTGAIVKQHVLQIQKLKKLRIIVYETDGIVKTEVWNMLNQTGPYRKEIVLSGAISDEFMTSLKGNKGVDITLDRLKLPLTDADLKALEGFSGRTRVVMAWPLSDADRKKIAEKKRIAVTLVPKNNEILYEDVYRLGTVNNQLTIEVTDLIDEAKYKMLFAVPQFDLQIRLTEPDPNPALIKWLKKTDP